MFFNEGCTEKGPKSGLLPSHPPNQPPSFFGGEGGGVIFTSFPEMSSIDGNINLKIDLVLNLFPFTDNISRKRVILQLFQ